MKFVASLLLVAAMCFAAPCFAEISVAPSLEWLTCSAEAIVVGKLSTIDTTLGPGDVTYEDCVVDVRQAIKGDVGYFGLEK